MGTTNTKPETTFNQKLEEVSAATITNQIFIQKYFNARKPVLLKGARADWPFMQKWTKDCLSTEIGNFQCKIARDSRPYHSNEKCSLKSYFENYLHLSTLTFELCDPKE